MNKTDLVNFFKSHALEDQVELDLQILNDNLKLLRHNNTLSISHLYDDILSHRSDRLISLNNSLAEVVISPCLPELAIVFKMSTELTIKPRASFDIILPVPLFIKLADAATPNKALSELPTCFMKKAWYGDYANGEIVYSQVLKADQYYTECNDPLVARAKVKVINVSDHDLQLNKLCLQTEYLSLYGSDLDFATNPISIFYKGGNNISEVKARHKIPKGYTENNLVCPARTQLRGSARLRSLGRFLEFTGIKFLGE